MRLHGKLVLAALAAVVMLATAVDAASARSLSVNEREFEIIWRELRYNFNSGAPSECAVTLLGSFHERTIAKRERALIGVIRHVSLGGPLCTARALRETLPWHVLYNSFEGVLPRISGVRLSLINVSLFIAGAECLVRTTTTNPLGGTAFLDPSGVIDGFTVSTSIPASGGGLCELLTFNAQGAATFTRLNSGELVIRLI